jgi:hypothetical protein
MHGASIPSLGLDQPPLEGRTVNHGSHKVAGLRQRKVRQLFEEQGPEAAWTLGLKLKLKRGTLRTWFEQWKRRKKYVDQRT